MGRKQVRCHGDDRRFEAVATLIDQKFSSGIRFVADVAGGQGLLSRLLTKRFNFESEVIDPRPHVLRGIRHQTRLFSADLSDYYDLIVGLHPDEAIKQVVQAGLYRPSVLVPCCNFWSEERIGLKEMIEDICRWYSEHGIAVEREILDFSGPYTTALITQPPDNPVLVRPPGLSDYAFRILTSAVRGSRRIRNRSRNDH